MLKVISVLKIRFDIKSPDGINLLFIADSNAFNNNPIARPISP